MENMKGQILYISHGGGPLPLLDDPSHKNMIDFMNELPKTLKKPEAIIVVSAHWEENVVTIQTGDDPGLIYDYYVFPEEAYGVKYPCKGNPELAAKIAEIFKERGIMYSLDDKRPYDHGSFVPLKMLYPEADIPVIQISLQHNFDTPTHLEIGRALRELLSENVLIIGSGFSFHNMKAFENSEEVADPLNDEFQDKLIEICCTDMEERSRREQMLNWEHIPNARYCHPREEHLMPLLVCVGASEGSGTKIFDNYIMGKRALAFLWS